MQDRTKNPSADRTGFQKIIEPGPQGPGRRSGQNIFPAAQDRCLFPEGRRHLHRGNHADGGAPLHGLCQFPDAFLGKLRVGICDQGIVRAKHLRSVPDPEIVPGAVAAVPWGSHQDHLPADLFLKPGRTVIRGGIVHKDDRIQDFIVPDPVQEGDRRVRVIVIQDDAYRFHRLFPPLSFSPAVSGSALLFLSSRRSFRSRISFSTKALLTAARASGLTSVRTSIP